MGILWKIYVCSVVMSDTVCGLHKLEITGSKYLCEKSSHIDTKFLLKCIYADVLGYIDTNLKEICSK